jgi:hypothetical protein
VELITFPADAVENAKLKQERAAQRRSLSDTLISIGTATSLGAAK